MSGSNRSERYALITLAICGVLVSAVIVWDVQFRHSHRHADYESYRQYERNQAANEIAIGCGIKLHCISEKLKTRDTKNNSNDDLTAQQKMAYWTGLIGLLTALMTALTAIAVWFVFRTAQFTSKTLDAAELTLDQATSATEAAWQTVGDTRDIGQAQTRAYLHCKSGKFELRKDKITAFIEIENTGQSPARSISIKCNMAFIVMGGEHDMPVIYDMIESIESDSRAYPIASNRTGRAEIPIFYEYSFGDFGEEIINDVIEFANEISFNLVISWVDVFGQLDEIPVMLLGNIDSSPSRTMKKRAVRGRLYVKS